MGWHCGKSDRHIDKRQSTLNVYKSQNERCFPKVYRKLTYILILKGIIRVLKLKRMSFFCHFSDSASLAISMICIFTILEPQFERNSHFKVRYLALNKYLDHYFCPPLFNTNVKKSHLSSRRQKWRKRDKICPNFNCYILSIKNKKNNCKFMWPIQKLLELGGSSTSVAYLHLYYELTPI